MSLDKVTELLDRVRSRDLPWRERRKIFVARLVDFFEAPRVDCEKAARTVFPPLSAAGAWRKLRSKATLRELGVDDDLIDAWRAVDDDGPFRDELKARFDGVAMRYSHVIVDEAQDLTPFQLRSVMRRADGLTLVGDDAQRSVAAGVGLRRAAELLDAPLEQMATAYRMSAEIATWLNNHAVRHHLDAVQLVGVRPTGIEVGTTTDMAGAARDLRNRWGEVAVIDHTDVWDHKGVEYDAVVVDTRGMDPSEIYLSASRAAHELIVAEPPPAELIRN
jgi:DNA helicase IV